MIYKLNQKTIQYLQTLPESGIGYQLIHARKEGELLQKNYVVFNSEIAIEYKDKLVNYSNTLNEKGYNILLQTLNIVGFEDITLTKNDETKNNVWNNTTLSIEADNHKIKVYDIYIRPSVYKKDNRLDLINKVLLPGSYVTTLESYTNCHIMRENPVEKYSLPVQQECAKIHYIKHTSEKNITTGTFKGTFGKKGGGIKLNFNDCGKLLIKESEY